MFYYYADYTAPRGVIQYDGADGMGRKRTSTIADLKTPALMPGATAVTSNSVDMASNIYVFLLDYFDNKDARASAICNS